MTGLSPLDVVVDLDAQEHRGAPIRVDEHSEIIG
jgi:hypothetical protein